MTFEHRHAGRMSLLKRLIVIFQAVAVAYLALHAAVTWFAYQQDGALNAIITFLTLGFGDLYWAIRWLRDGGLTGEAAVASVAALVCFASWITRPMFDRWAARFTHDMLADSSREIGKFARDAADGELADDQTSTGQDARRL